METSISIFFSAITDPRIERKKLYPLEEILLIGLCSIISGGEGFADMRLYGEEKIEVLKQLCPFENGIASEDTFARVFSLLDPSIFRDCFAIWVQSIIKRTGKTIAIDGKTARRTKFKNQQALHTVTAWADAEGLVLAQKPVEGKSNEIVAIKELLEVLDLKGSVITIDAMGCQKAITKRVVERDGDYVLALKDNQRKLSHEVKEVFSGNREIPFGETKFDVFKSTEKGHGRFEQRTCRVIDVTNLPIDTGEWTGIKSLVEITSIREIGEKKSEGKRYFISSLEEGAEAISRYVRSHWGIENRLHWVLDVVFREDDSRIHQRNAAENVAVLRHLAMNLVRQDPGKRSLRGKRKKAAWSDNYLMALLRADF
jgi:predicted transposase YbfD/YdcC